MGVTSQLILAREPKAASIKAECEAVLSHSFLYSTLCIFVPIAAFGSIWNFISKDSEKQNGKVENT